jgi:hypothetical protein
MDVFVEHHVITRTATREFVMEKDTAFLKKIIHVLYMDVVKSNVEINVYRVTWWEFVMLKDNVNTI